MHVLASKQPIPLLNATQLLQRLPPAARRDLLEWTPQADAAELIQKVTSSERAPEDILRMKPEFRITDDEPYNGTLDAPLRGTAVIDRSRRVGGISQLKRFVTRSSCFSSSSFLRNRSRVALVNSRTSPLRVSSSFSSSAIRFS